MATLAPSYDMGGSIGLTWVKLANIWNSHRLTMPTDDDLRGLRQTPAVEFEAETQRPRQLRHRHHQERLPLLARRKGCRDQDQLCR
ncbi:hypothetical protein HBH98_248160 [Parastagonospora nodorum]|nr:hypothetical protein HBH53_264690 [Parastagonospora nodorum]KAH3955966.1 hypothetical protein HBH51_259370 [Parastagonospora nodorum]KAH4333501.1 hypothetical protein HBH98_248160 [Parastagonospora nodorum]KAH4354964.1 hypothetical protein HBH97_242510 [Parastagonospora nodorum]KAH4368349.1 hypothetical protein HBH99_250270 [Parastagonospora nodorum]